MKTPAFSKLQFSLHSLTLFAILALGASCDAFDRPMEKSMDSGEGTVRNLPARDFYKPFLYDLFTKEKALVSELSNAIETGSDSESAPRLNGDRFPGVNLFILTDGSYYFEYLEGRAGGYGGVTTLESVLFNGTWEIVDGRIALGAQATLQLNPDAGAGLEVTFLKDVVSPGLARKPFNLQALSVADQGDDLLDTVLKKHGHRPIPPPSPN